MALTEAQKRAQAKYKKSKVTQIGLSFYPSESDLLEHLREQPNKAGYIKELIRKDMQN